MSTSGNAMLFGSILVALSIGFLAISGIVRGNRNIDWDLYSRLCSLPETTGDYQWNLVIYLDVDACVGCTEDFDAWRLLGEQLPSLGGVLTLRTVPEDSLDIARAMELEGLDAPVGVVNRSLLDSLGWVNFGAPIKILFDGNCRVRRTILPRRSPSEARQVIEQLLADLASGRYDDQSD